jgi:hypothetical protein
MRQGEYYHAKIYQLFDFLIYNLLMNYSDNRCAAGVGYE